MFEPGHSAAIADVSEVALIARSSNGVDQGENMIRRRNMAAVVVASLVMAACSSDNETAHTTATTTPAAATETSAAATTEALATNEPAAAETTATGATDATDATAATEAASATSAAETAPPETNAAPAADEVCGLGTGQPASGDPIKIGAITTQIPGVDLSAGPAGAKAYFDCVNDNGGINGRPIEFIVENDQLDPGAAAAAGKKLVESDNVVLLAGGVSILDCALNGAYYAEQGFNVITGGVGAACFGLPHIAPVNGGPAYSGQFGAQYVASQGATGKIVFVAPKVPGVEYFSSAAQTWALANGFEYEAIYPDTPVQDGAAVALDAVTRAGKGGGVIVSGSPQDTATILQAAAEQGLIDDVHWAAGASAQDVSLVEALGPEWDGKVGVDAEVADVNGDAPDIALYREVMGTYGGDVAIGAFSAFGYLMAEIAVKAMLGIDGDVTKESANAALKAVAGYTSDFLCKPFYFGDSDLHLANNSQRILTPDGDGFAAVTGCTPLDPVDDVVKAVYAYEKANGI